MEENQSQLQPEASVEPKSKYEYGPNDKPKGKVTVVAEDPIELFPPEHGDLEQPTK